MLQLVLNHHNYVFVLARLVMWSILIIIQIMSYKTNMDSFLFDHPKRSLVRNACCLLPLLLLFCLWKTPYIIFILFFWSFIIILSYVYKFFILFVFLCCSYFCCFYISAIIYIILWLIFLDIFNIFFVYEIYEKKSTILYINI